MESIDFDAIKYIKPDESSVEKHCGVGCVQQPEEKGNLCV